MTVQDLIKTAIWLDAYSIPVNCWDLSENGGPTRESGRRGGTHIEMRTALGRDLTHNQSSCLSLSRAYGWNGLPDEVSAAVVAFLWPEGNDRGLWLSWAALELKLKEYQILRLESP